MRTLFALLAILSVAAASASATPPGKNGQIVFRRYTDAGRTTGALFMKTNAWESSVDWGPRGS